MKIKADTLSVILKGSSTVCCGVSIDGNYTNLTLRFDRGLKAQLCGYPQTWNIHDVPVDQYDSSSPTGADLQECDGIEDGGQPYISAQTEAEILAKLKRSVAAQFRSKDWSKHCPKREQQTILRKIGRAIEKLSK